MRERITLFHKDLMPNASPRRIEVHAVLTSEDLDGCVFVEVLVRLVLDIVIQSEYRLRRVEYLRCAD